MSSAKIGQNTIISETAIIHPNVEIGDNCVIEDFCIIGYPAPGNFKGKVLKIGDNSTIRSHSTLYEGSIFGEGLKVGHKTLIREGTNAGVNFQVGSLNDIEGEISVGKNVRFHSNVHVGKGAVIEDYVWIFPYVVLTNDPIPPSGLMEGVTLRKASIVCTQSVILPGVTVGKGAMVGAFSRISKNVPDCKIAVGGDGKIVGDIDRLRHKSSGKQHPWMNFYRNYPDEYQAELDSLLIEIEEILLRNNAKS